MSGTRWLPFGEDERADDLPAGRPPAALHELLEQVGRRRGWQRRLDGAQVHARWEEIAGADLARQVTPVRLVGGVLVVRASSPAWAAQVRYLTRELAARANEVLGEGSVVKVTVVSTSTSR